MPSMNLMIYSPLDPTLVGGMRTWLLNFWKRYAAERGHRVTFVHTGTRPTADPGAYKDLDELDGIAFQHVEGRMLPGSGAYLPRVADLKRAFHGADVVYVDNSYVLHDVVALRAAKAVGAFTVSGHHSVIMHRDHRLTGRLHNMAWAAIGRRTIRNFDRVHALNSSDGRYLTSAGASDVRVVGLPIDDDLFHPAAAARRREVLFAGRLHHQKGIEQLTQIIDHLLARDLRVVVRIVGAGPERHRLRRFEHCPRVALSPPLLRPELASLMREVRVVVAPSQSETFGFVAAESLASGTPVVCTPTAGFLDLVSADAGVIMPFRASPQSWVDKITDILDLAPEDFGRMSLAARCCVRRLSYSDVACDFDEVISPGGH